MTWWTTEQVAEFLDIEPQQVYESRRRNEYPGNLGVRQGRALRFPQNQVEAGPQEPTTTENGAEAILWAISGLHETLRAIHNELRKHRTYSLDEALEHLGYTREEIENYDEREADND